MPASRRLTSAQQRVMALLADGWEIDMVGSGFLLENGDDCQNVSTWTVQSLIRRQLIVLIDGRWVARP